MLLGMLQQTTEKNPDKTALICGESRTTYQALYEQVGCLYQGLKGLGVAEGDTVVVALPNCPEFVISFYATAGLGARLLPLNPFLTDGEMARYLRENPQTRALVTDAAWLPRWRQAVSQVECQGAPAADAIRFVVTDSFGAAWETQPGTVAFHELLRKAGRGLPALEYTGDFLIQYSSGSTGTPKQVHRTQANLFHQAHNCTQTIGVAAADAILAVVPLYHAYGIGECLLAATSTGAGLVIPEQAAEQNHPVQSPFVFRREYILGLIDRHQITILPLVPYMVSVLASTPPESQASLASLRWCFSAGTFLTQEVFEQFRKRWGISVRQLYGCTEAGAVAVNLEAETSIAYNAIGQPMANVQMKIVDGTGQPVAVGAVGQLAIRSQTIATGCVNGDGYFLAGDLARLDDQGRIYVTGRQRPATQHKSGPLVHDPALQGA